MGNDKLQNDLEELENLYKRDKLKKSRASAKTHGTLSTDDVRNHFEESRRNLHRCSGGLKERFDLPEDFDELPECFRVYME